MSFPCFSLEGRRALVTGSSQGIGLALAKGLAEHGAAIILNGRGPGKIEVASAELSAKGHKVSTAIFDVTSAEAVRTGIEAIEGEGPIDILINNAGMQFRTPLEDFPVDSLGADSDHQHLQRVLCRAGGRPAHDPPRSR